MESPQQLVQSRSKPMILKAPVPEQKQKRESNPIELERNDSKTNGLKTESRSNGANNGAVDRRTLCSEPNGKNNEDVMFQEKPKEAVAVTEKLRVSTDPEERRDVRPEMRELRKDMRSSGYASEKPQNSARISPTNALSSSSSSSSTPSPTAITTHSPKSSSVHSLTSSPSPTLSSSSSSQPSSNSSTSKSSQPPALQSLVSIDESAPCNYSVQRAVTLEDGSRQRVATNVTKKKTPTEDEYEEEVVVETEYETPGGKHYETTETIQSKRKVKKTGSNYFQRDAYLTTKVRDAQGHGFETTDIVSVKDSHSASRGQHQTETVETTIIKDDGSGKEPMIEAEEVNLGGGSSDSSSSSSSSSESSSSSSESESSPEESEDSSGKESEEEQEEQNTEPPEVIDPLLNTTVLDGDPLILTCRVQVPGSVTHPKVIWYHGEKVLTPGGDFQQTWANGIATLAIGEVFPDDEGEYRCVVRCGGAEAETRAHVTVKENSNLQAPRFTMPLKDVTAAEGVRVILQCQLTGQPQPQIEWFQNGLLLRNNSDFKQSFNGVAAKLVITDPYTDDTGTYTCTAKSIAGEAKSSCIVTVKDPKEVKGKAPTFRTSLLNIIAKEGDMVVYEAHLGAGAEPTPEVTWTRNGDAIPSTADYEQTFDGTVARLVVREVFRDDAGTIKVAARNSVGEVSSSARLTVKALAPAPAFAKPLTDLVVQDGRRACLQCSIGGAEKEANVVWYKNGKVARPGVGFEQTFDGKTAKFVISQVFPDDDAEYECRVKTDDFEMRTKCKLSVTDNAPSTFQQHSAKFGQNATAAEIKNGLGRHANKAATGGFSLQKFLSERMNQEKSQPSPLPTTTTTSSSNMPELKDIDEIEDEDVLHTMLGETEEFDDRRKIRARLREIREKRTAEFTHKRLQREGEERAKQEERRRQAEAEKHRRRESLTNTLPGVFFPGLNGALASKKTTGPSIPAMAESSEEAVFRSTKTEKAPGGGNTTTTTTTTKQTSKDGTVTTVKQSKQVTQTGNPGGTNIVITKTSADKCAKRLADVFSNRGVKTTSGLVSVKTEGWTSEEGTINRHEKTLQWGGSVKRKGKTSSRGAMAAFKQMDGTNNPGGSKPNFGGGLSPTSPTTPGGGRVAVQRSPSAIKQMLLEWCVRITQGYEHVSITNFSSSWNDGMAFCAMMHHFYPRAFDYKKLNPKCRRGNFKLAFDVAEKLGGVAPLLDVDDMVKMKNPDWKCVFTYVQALYRRFREEPKKEEEKKEEDGVKTED